MTQQLAVYTCILLLIIIFTHDGDEDGDDGDDDGVDGDDDDEQT